MILEYRLRSLIDIYKYPVSTLDVAGATGTSKYTLLNLEKFLAMCIFTLLRSCNRERIFCDAGDASMPGLELLQKNTVAGYIKIMT